MNKEYKNNEEGFQDEVGGIHENALGWNPQGVFCGECYEKTCKGCLNEFDTE